MRTIVLILAGLVILSGCATERTITLVRTRIIACRMPVVTPPAMVIDTKASDPEKILKSELVQLSLLTANIRTHERIESECRRKIGDAVGHR